ncbi:MAG: hypothetical protein ACI4QA_04095 [Candidatus Spyradosoma sp.]
MMKRILFRTGTALALCALGVPAARAMLASDGGNVSHNTDPGTAETDITELWNRTAYLGAGTGTYLGQAADGTYWVLTANHVSSLSGTITDADGATHTLAQDTTVSAIQLENSDGSAADLKLFAVTPGDEATAAYLDALGSIDVFTGALYTNTPLWVVGTGQSTDLGGSYASGFERQKQWAEFCADAADTSSATPYIIEKFSRTGASVQCTNQDSGSGAFVKNGDAWELVCVAVGVAGNATGATKIGFAEDADAANPTIFETYFIYLAPYAEQIRAIMAIPEPGAFSLFAGTLALAFCASRRRRKRT